MFVNFVPGIMSHPALRKRMLANHAFLYKLYVSNGRRNRHILGKATKKQLRNVLQILHCISAGHIPMTKQNFQEIIRRKKRLLLAHLKRRFITLWKKEPMITIRNYVLKYSSVYPYLFQPLFMEI